MNRYSKGLPQKPELTVNPADPTTIPKFVDPLPIPAIAEPGICYTYSGKTKLLYHMVMREARHRFHRYFPLTTIWGYNGTYPGPTIEVPKDSYVQVKWENKLPLRHLFPVDHTLHGTVDTPDVRTVVHLHGANVEADSDGTLKHGFPEIIDTWGQSLPEEYMNIPIISLGLYYGITIMRWE